MLNTFFVISQEVNSMKNPHPPLPTFNLFRTVFESPVSWFLEMKKREWGCVELWLKKQRMEMKKKSETESKQKTFVNVLLKFIAQKRTLNGLLKSKQRRNWIKLKNWSNNSLQTYRWCHKQISVWHHYLYILWYNAPWLVKTVTLMTYNIRVLYSRADFYSTRKILHLMTLIYSTITQLRPEMALQHWSQWPTS